MPDYGNILIGESGRWPQKLPIGVEVERIDAAGAKSTHWSLPIDANIAQQVTTTFDHNFSTDNDFTIPVPATLGFGKIGGSKIHIRPDTVDDLKELATKSIARHESLCIYNHESYSSPVGTIEPTDLLKALKDAGY